MKVSELWLRDWVNPSITGSKLAQQLTMAGLEVDSISPVAGAFSRVVVAKVLATSAHPQADKLTLCDVDAGSGTPLRIVCGASNVRPGLMVALALIGSELPGGMTIKESKLRGELSQGMLCSASELGLDDNSEGILELANDAPIGCSLREYLLLDDQIFDLDLTPNRADCFSMLGVAREVAALNSLPLPTVPFVVCPAAIKDVIAVDILAPEACPKYCSRMIRGINPHAITPLWIKERLRRGGIRSLHPVVDIINYVMLELGQPMHAFDAKMIEGSIQVRYAHDGETLELLDGQDITLNQKVLLIADAKKPLAIAGVMGGELSAVTEDTIDICLESAFFNPIIIAGVARRLHLFSDSSQRFERGVDSSLQVIALERATELLQSVVGGLAGPISTNSSDDLLPSKATISFQPSLVKQLTGVELADKQILDILTALGMTVNASTDVWSVDVPTHRFDVTLDVDLVEEVLRLYGYDHIQALPLVSTVQAGKPNQQEQLARELSSFLSHHGYHETINYSFVDPMFQEALYPDVTTMQLKNPISSELSQMRVGLWPGLLASMLYNAHRQQTAIKLFEVGTVFEGEGEALQEHPSIAGLLTGELGGLNWSESTRSFDFYDMKGDLQSLFALLNCENVSFVPCAHPALHPGQSAQIMVNAKHAGWLGALHPRLAEDLDLSNDVLLFELSLTSLLEINPARYQAISKYPQIRRDLSLVADEKISAEQIEGILRDVIPVEWLKAVEIFDVYRGDKIPSTKKSLAIALILQDTHRTLVDTEINTVISTALKKLDDDIGVQLRD